jgi:membrane AbrB-like protein
MVIYVTFVAGSVGFLFYRFVKVDIATSYFSATPGGLATMVILGAEKGGNEQTIALTHSVRILLTVLIIPLWLQFFEGYTINSGTNFAIFSNFSIQDIFILSGCGIAGFFIGKLVKLPSYQLLGPMLVSTFVHLLGFSEANLPTEIINIAQVVIGSGIGARFAGISILHVSKVLLSSIATTIYIISLAAIIAWGLASITGLPFQALWIAFAPGGLAEMSLLSLSMGVDPAFVSTHHLLRVSFMILMAPIVFKIFEK